MTGLIRRVERAVLPQVQRPTDLTAPSAMAGTEALAQGLQDVGDLFQEWQNDIDTADAMAADAAFTERANDLLYNDTTGFMYSEGSNATSGRNGAVTALEEARESILGQLSTGARVRAEGPLGARAESMITRVNQHTGQQRLSYLQQAADARVAASINTAIAEPDSINEQYGIAINTLRDRAAREGWPAERLALEEQGVADNIILGNIRRISATDPEQALELLRANEARLSGVGLAEAEERLLPAAMEARGQRLGRVAATGASPDPLQISGNMSSQPAIYDRVAQAWAYVMPPGSQIVVSSAHRPNGSATSQHHSGDAIDYHVTRPDGSRVQWDDPEALAAARFGAALGVRGVGAGFDYMGGDHFHWDLGQNPNNVRGGIQVWTDSDGVNNRDPRGAVSWIEDLRAAEAMGVDGLLEEMGASSEPITMTDLLARLDGQPDAVRDAAIREYELRIGASAHDERVAHEDLMDAANALVINGGSVTDLDIDVRQALSAEGLQQAYALERMIASGAAPSTDPQTYVDLTRMMSDDPEQFEEIDMIEFATTLTQSDFERFVTLQGQMRAARRGQGGGLFKGVGMQKPVCKIQFFGAHQSQGLCRPKGQRCIVPFLIARRTENPCAIISRQMRRPRQHIASAVFGSGEQADLHPQVEMRRRCGNACLFNQRQSRIKGTARL